MTIESDLFTALTGYAGLMALIVHRLYPDVRPQGATLPCVVYKRISTPRAQAFGSAQTVVRSRPRFQFDCWATTAAGALALCAELRAGLLATSFPVTLASEYTGRDPDSAYACRHLDAFVGHTGE
ncbi:MAG TPA: DUF3168 domain-containing protein [Thermoleophilia bacterium]|nr:DUF3168 domain-containing protein [Thermoleophilia bacterium]